jgi:hypothetical protein
MIPLLPISWHFPEPAGDFCAKTNKNVPICNSGVLSDPAGASIFTDGGLQATSGTFGWKMLDNRKLVLYQGSGPVDDPFDSANLTRCEMGGLFATPMLLLTVIAKYWGIRHRCKLNWME